MLEPKAKTELHRGAAFGRGGTFFTKARTSTTVRLIVAPLCVCVREREGYFFFLDLNVLAIFTNQVDWH